MNHKNMYKFYNSINPKNDPKKNPKRDDFRIFIVSLYNY